MKKTIKEIKAEDLIKNKIIITELMEEVSEKKYSLRLLNSHKFFKNEKTAILFDYVILTGFEKGIDIYTENLDNTDIISDTIIRHKKFKKISFDKEKLNNCLIKRIDN